MDCLCTNRGRVNSDLLGLIYIVLLMVTCLESSNQTDWLALLDFKSQITEDPNQIMKSWNESVHFCEWFGVTCDPRNRRVAVLNLKAQKLVGIIPSSIGNLTLLTGLNLINNNFRGHLPQEIGRLNLLRDLNLSNNMFRGEIPSNLSHCKELRLINFASNEFFGKIPHLLGSLLKLTKLNFNSNNLTGRISPWIANLSSLQYIYFSNNNLDGFIPNELGYLPKLEFLQLTGNHFTGTIPSSIYNISSLYFLVVTQNNLHGELPADVGLTLPSLEIFAGGVNNFTGLIPVSLPNATKLRLFDFAQNSLTGPVPISFGKLPSLFWLDLDDNMLGTGKGSGDLNFIPFLANCTDLSVLRFARNKLAGELPASIANLSASWLETLTAGGNLIHGKIPVGIGNLVQLSLLGFEDNYLTGNIPQSIGNLNKLVGLYLNVNRFSGSIPSSLGNLTALLRLFMEENRFKGSIPSSLGKLSNLLVLNFSHNKLTGTIPIELLGLSSLSVSLSLSHNSLSGMLPVEIGTLQNLKELDISENKLSGFIPSSLGKCISLEVLSLRENAFGGTIPRSLSSLRGLEVIDLSRNNFSGEIPDFLAKILPLRLLNLSYNNFEGQVSKEGIFANKSVISVSGNYKLCGGISELHLPACKTNVKRHFPRLLIGLTIGLIVLVVISSSLIICYKINCSRKRKFSMNLKQNISYSELVRATDGFSAENVIASSSISTVYKGMIPGEAKPVAIKVIKLETQEALKSFENECNALRNLRHRNLLKIITCCSSIDYQGREFKALVFDFMPNGTLELWLHETDFRMQKLSFIQRLDIAIEVASALDYLHHRCESAIVHCDLKPSNILLDDSMVARVCDFGLSRFLDQGSDGNLSSVLKGSIGYIPPEYGMGGQVSVEGDVYSYGILLLEMFTGKRPTDDMFQGHLNISQYVTSALDEHNDAVFDESMVFEEEEDIEAQDFSDENRLNNNERTNEGRTIKESLELVMRTGVLCSAALPNDRTDMYSVLNNLQAIRRRI